MPKPWARGKCPFCHATVTQNETAAFRVYGYEIERSQGGANSIKGRVRDPDWIAHAACLEAHLRYGAQEALDV